MMPLYVRYVLVGLAFAVAGVLATTPHLLAADDPMDSARMLAPAAAMAAFAVGCATWALLVSGDRRPWMATLAGAITGVLAHPVMWALISIEIGDEMGVGLIQHVGGTMLSGAFFGMFSALAYGVVTVPLAAFVGWLLGRSPALRGTVARSEPALNDPGRA